MVIAHVRARDRPRWLVPCTQTEDRKTPDLSRQVKATILVSSERFLERMLEVLSGAPLFDLSLLFGFTGAEVSVLQAVEQFVQYTSVRPGAELIEKAAAFARS
jgi:shikimate dehydrogenase